VQLSDRHRDIEQIEVKRRTIVDFVERGACMREYAHAVTGRLELDADQPTRGFVVFENEDSRTHDSLPWRKADGAIAAGVLIRRSERCSVEQKMT
jgi:hypothetical protein